MPVAHPDPADDRAFLDALRAALGRGEARASERTLAGELGVTRHRLRQGLEALRGEGEITEPPRRLGRARPAGRQSGEMMIRGTNPIEVIELRVALEPTLARFAALRATPFDIARIERAATTLVDMDTGAADLAFHRLVAGAAGNALAAEFYAMLRRVGTDVRVRVAANRPVCPNRLRQRDAEHRAIAAAIAARDANAAEAAMRRHLETVQAQILGRLTASAGAA